MRINSEITKCLEDWIKRSWYKSTKTNGTILEKIEPTQCLESENHRDRKEWSNDSRKNHKDDKMNQGIRSKQCTRLKGPAHDWKGKNQREKFSLGWIFKSKTHV